MADTTPVTTTPPTAADMQAQADANYARQLDLQMKSEQISANTNTLKTTHDTQMAVIQNFKS